MSECTPLTNDSFDGVLAANDVVLVDFWATWCGPCRMLSPVVDKLAESYGDKVFFGKVDVDECEELAMRYGIMSIPAVFIFKNGEVVEKAVGFRSEAQLAASIEKYIEK